MTGFQGIDMQTTWTAEQIEILRVQWGHGLTGREIGKMIGKTRNAVIGKAHRLKLEARVERVRATQPRAPKEQVTPKPKRSPRKKDDDSVAALAKKLGGRNAPVFYAPSEPLEGREPISIMELNARTCRAIVGRAPNGLATYCGADVFPGKSCCPTHYSLYYRPSQERRWA
jgi:GcrA cell cycle regulator